MTPGDKMKVEKEPPLVIITSHSIYPTGTWTDSSLSAASSVFFFMQKHLVSYLINRTFENFSAHQFSYQAETPNIAWIRLLPSLIYILVNLMYLVIGWVHLDYGKLIMAYLFFPFSYFPNLLNPSQVPALNSDLGCTLYCFISSRLKQSKWTQARPATTFIPLDIKNKTCTVFFFPVRIYKKSFIWYNFIQFNSFWLLILIWIFLVSDHQSQLSWSICQTVAGSCLRILSLYMSCEQFSQRQNNYKLHLIIFFCTLMMWWSGEGSWELHRNVLGRGCVFKWNVMPRSVSFSVFLRHFLTLLERQATEWNAALLWVKIMNCLSLYIVRDIWNNVKTQQNKVIFRHFNAEMLSIVKCIGAQKKIMMTFLTWVIMNILNS